MARPTRMPEVTMQDLDGVMLRTAYWPVSGAARELPLVFFNGIGANLELTLGLGDMFPDREILTFDVPGVGLSPVPQLPSGGGHNGGGGARGVTGFTRVPGG